MKNTIVAILTLIILGAAGWVASKGGAYNGGSHSTVVISDLGSKNKGSFSTPDDEGKKEQDKLKALRDKAGNIGAFKVSQEYKSKCASCHGVNGSGEQNGKPLMGPKLFGQSAEKIYKDLIDFKAGRRENVVMKGLLMPLDEQTLRRLADEIGEFPKRAKEHAEKNR